MNSKRETFLSKVPTEEKSGLLTFIVIDHQRSHI